MDKKQRHIPLAERIKNNHNNYNAEEWDTGVVGLENLEDAHDLKHFDINYQDVEKGKWYSQNEIEKELGLLS